MLKGINVLICVILTGFVHSQNLTDDLRKIVESADSSQSISIETVIKAYNKKGGTVVYSTNAQLIKKGETNVSVLADQEHFVDANYEVTVDHEEKAVLILKKEKNAASKKKEKLDADTRGLLKYFEEDASAKKFVAKVIDSQSNNKTYSVTNISGIKEIKIVLDMTALKIKQITYEYSEEGDANGQYITVNYTSFLKNNNVESKLQRSHFFSVDGTTYKLSSRLSHYKLYTEL